LRIDGGSASPAVLEKKVIAAAHARSYAIGGLLLRTLGGIDLSGRGLNKTAVKIGTEMAALRDAQAAAYFNQPLPRQPMMPKTPISLACVGIDGGRMQTRAAGGGRGVHDPHWRETKNALFSRMQSPSFDCDPHPDLPTCFADRLQMKTLLSGVAPDQAGTQQPDDPSQQAAGESVAAEPASAAAPPTSADPWRPKPLFRTCLSSLLDSTAFGRLMEVEADARGFYHADKQAFVSDGLPYNWTIQARHFRDFTPILDFVHVVEHLYEAARCLHTDGDRRWQVHLGWTRACWSGQVQQVIAEMKQHQVRLGLPPKDGEKTDPRKVLADAIGYFEHNASRMNYPQYRQDGLPVTSSLMESLVKEINLRVKGTEKFWDDGARRCPADDLPRQTSRPPLSPQRPQYLNHCRLKNEPIPAPDEPRTVRGVAGFDRGSRATLHD
jgi:hypothetical protein